LDKAIYYIGCSESFWLEIAKEMRKRNDWRAVYWTGGSEFKKSVLNEFPDCYYQVNIDAAMGRFAKGAPRTRLLDAKMMKACSQEMLLAMDQMDRMDPLNAFSFQERWDHFKLLMNHWLETLHDTKPAIIFFSQPPHMVYDYVLYILCRHLNIFTLMCFPTAVPARSLVMSSFEEGPLDVIQGYHRRLKSNQSTEVELSPEIQIHWEKSQQQYSQATPAFLRDVKQKNLDAEADRSWKSRLVKYSRPLQLSKNLIQESKRIIGPAPANYIKEPGKSIINSRISGRDWWRHRKRSMARQERLAKDYQNLTKSFDIRQNYVFFALHYQPEMTTNPLGGIFTDQNLALEMLSEALPKDWHIYIKEAPASLSSLYRHSWFRDAAWYERMAAIPKVRLLDVSLSPFELIDHCRCTATITGTAGWESILRGKPCLVFGHAWYRWCEGVKQVSDHEDLKAWFGKLANDKVSVDQHKVRLFLQTIDQDAVHGFVDSVRRKDFNLDEAVSVRNLSDALQRYT
jgi:hypothetical protein